MKLNWISILSLPAKDILPRRIQKENFQSSTLKTWDKKYFDPTKQLQFVFIFVLQWNIFIFLELCKD